MTKQDALNLKPGDKVYNNHYKRIETVVRVQSESGGVNLGGNFPLLITEEIEKDFGKGEGVTYLLYKTVEKK